MYSHHTTLYTKSSGDLRSLVAKEDWMELIRISKDVIQTSDVKDNALQCAIECLRNIADNNYRLVEKHPENSTECSNRLLAIITNRTLQSLAGREIILEYVGKKMIEICALDPECYYNLINIANNSEIRSNINLKALAAYYRLMFGPDGRLSENFRTEIDYAIRHLNVRYINILLMTYDIHQEEADEIYLLMNHIRSKRD